MTLKELVKNIDCEIFGNSETEIKGIAAYEPVLEDHVFLKYGNRDAIATVRGVKESYLNRNHIHNNLVEGETKIRQEDRARGRHEFPHRHRPCLLHRSAG